MSAIVPSSLPMDFSFVVMYSLISHQGRVFAAHWHGEVTASRLCELLEQAHEEAPNRLGAAQHAGRCEEPRLGGVVSHGAGDIAERVQVVCEYVLGSRSDCARAGRLALRLFHIFLL